MGLLRALHVAASVHKLWFCFQLVGEGKMFWIPGRKGGGGGTEQGRRHGRLRPEVLLNGHQHLQGGTRASPVERLMSFYPPCPSGIVREAQYLPSLPALLPAKQN